MFLKIAGVRSTEQSGMIQKAEANPAFCICSAPEPDKESGSGAEQMQKEKHPP